MIAQGEDCWVVAPEDLKAKTGWPSDPEENVPAGGLPC